MGPVGTLNFDPTAGEAPPQAPEPTTTLDAFANLPTSVPSPTDVLRTAAYGDKGAQQYADLAAAGQQRVNPGLAGITGSAPAPAASTSVGPGDLMALLGDVASGAAGDPQAGMKRQAAELALAQRDQAMHLQAQAAAQTTAKSDIEFYDKLKGVLPQYRPALAQDYFGKQGRAIPTSMAAMITDQQALTDLTSATTKARVQSDPHFAALYFTSIDKPKEMLTLLDDIRKGDADADKAVDDAAKAHAQAQAEPAKLRGDAAKAALDIASKIRQTNKPPSLEDMQMLDSADMTAWQVPIPGVAGGKMWTTGPKRLAPSSALDVRDVEEQKAAAKAPAMTIQRAREQVGSAQETAKVLLGMLNDPKFDAAKKSLGPNLTANVAGYQVGPSKFNRAWRNYSDYGGQGNSSEQNQLMEAIGYYTGTGFQAFLSGLRNQKIVEDIRIHIPQPFDKEDTIRSKINYLSGRYTDVLKEFAKGGRPTGAQAGLADSNAIGSTAAPAAGAPAAGGPPAGATIINFDDL